MLEIIGWLFGVVILMWCTLFVAFVTLSTFGETLFTGKWWQKLIGVLMWITVLVAWIAWFSLLEVKING